jgi:hypothetical protein
MGAGAANVTADISEKLKHHRTCCRITMPGTVRFLLYSKVETGGGGGGLKKFEPVPI